MYSYCPGPMMPSPQKVNWNVVTEEPVTSHHILCHQLVPKENVSDFLRKCNAEYTCAVVFVTYNDSFLLSRDHSWEKMAAPSFPVCVINKVGGEKLLDNVRGSNAGGLMMCISNVNVDFDTNKSLSPEDLSLTLEEAKSKL